MGEEPARVQRRAVNRLTVLKLAIQMLDRRVGLSDDQRVLVRTALAAADGLAADVLACCEAAGRGEATGRPSPDPTGRSRAGRN